ncbi:MAG: twin-arginine translocase TatA/TatE family subunit [Bacteroidales bacterium]|nr:twin-arginine translocase TatA/TatE family subunit [Bacteroidales bacterium]MBR4679093.1 twin-arginine translocase TatA/TatE family subunit [Bacteroidales bacterium]
MILLGIIGTQEIIFILIIILVLFGAKKIPELMRGLGKGVKEFKDGMNGLDGNAKDTEKQPSEDKKTTSEN